MMKRFNPTLAAAVAVIGLAAAAAVPTFASAAATVMSRQDARAVVNQAKADGIIGEMSDGYVGVRLEARMTPAIRAAMGEMNAGRAELYRQAGQSTGTTAAAAGASSYQQRFSSIPAGQWYRDDAGTWRQR
ncbi:MAG: DUF1318 domain-containing protein [Caulobacterales bacterium]|nr:DUF1318 domain-containing protein [Caulobacterales bacterium]